MQKMKKTKLAIPLVLLIIMFTNHPLNTSGLSLDPVLPVAPESAASISPIEHQRIVREYANQIRLLHNRAFQFVQSILDSPIRNAVELRHNINLINIEIDSIRRRIRDYLSTVQTTRKQNSDVLLLFNVLNHTSNQLFYLEQLTYATSNVEKAIYLERFFRARQATIDTLVAIEDFISEDIIFN
jgi:hypothetical protein